MKHTRRKIYIVKTPDGVEHRAKDGDGVLLIRELRKQYGDVELTLRAAWSEVSIDASGIGELDNVDVRIATRTKAISGKKQVHSMNQFMSAVS